MHFQAFLLRLLTALLLTGGAVAHAADGLLDFSVVRPPLTQDRAIKEPIVTWVVASDKANMEEQCSSLQGFDGGGVWREGCVAWSVESSRCTVVTHQSSSHSLLGRLLLMCMKASAEAS